MKIKQIIIALVSSLMISTAANADGHVKYTITSANVADYASMLNPGQMLMLTSYPDTYKIDVYEDSASCVVDPDIEAISQTNGTMVNDNEGIEVPNFGQTPFPDPSQAQHFVWNYRMFAG